jgi:glucose/arabinose dehydrogenase
MLSRAHSLRRNMLRSTLALAAAFVCAALASAQWPAGFSSTTVASGWTQPTGIAFAADGRMFVWEKAGQVWLVDNGVKSAQPVIDISDEVGNWRDYGLLGFALDPAFLQNGRIYLAYVVDYYHLTHFGAHGYDPAANQYFHDTIARVTRYTLDVSSPTLALVPGSRTVLIGESIATGIPICFQSHGVGSLVFAADGTLFLSTGESASYDQVDTGGPVTGSSNTALADGIIRPKEDVGAFRAQLVDSLSGKILRFDPATGDGISSNPFFDASAPRAPRSRVWALGLRNPFRMALQPQTGAHDPAVGRPGTLWIGDVGWNNREEMNVCDGPGLDFGWPLYEGLEPHSGYAAQSTRNLDAPNPLAGSGGCNQTYFAFRDLLIQDTNGAPSWPNPCDGNQQIPPSVPRFVHKRPLVDWFHADTGPARTGTFNGAAAAVIDIGTPGAPLAGVQFGGDCSTGGVWYSGIDFPAAYRHSYYFADYVHGWIRQVVCDALGAPIEVRPFAEGGEVSGVVELATDPVNGGLYYIRYAETSGPSEVRRIFHTNDLPPIAAVDVDVHYGPVPLTVHFSSAGSRDPENQPLSCLWDFGDGTTSTASNPTHVYGTTSDITAQGTIIARVFELNPPHPTGGGSWNPEVIRDGDTPPVGGSDSARQFDTYHGGQQGNVDWIGYSFATPRTFHALVFQEGMQFQDGGWFDQLRVEVGDGTTWTLVGGLSTTPAYAANNGISFETYRLDFTPVTGTRIRIVGTPGGSADFISVGELRVLAEDPLLLTQPTRRDVTLTVRDPSGSPGTTTTIVSLNNTPPSVHITSPIDGSTYPLDAAITPALTANVSDLEQSGAQLTCAWQTILHHDDHTHPEPIDPACTTSTVITPLGCDGPTYAYEIALTVTDSAGLSGEDHVFLHPACTPVVVCAGDGSGTACPCGNTGALGHGCENSLGTGGGRLDASGSARVGNDTLLLSATALPPTTFALFFQGDALTQNGSGSVFGDGLRCAGGNVRRLATRMSAAGACAIGAPVGDAPVSTTGALTSAGGVRYYQAWYRNSAAFCTSATFNLTNALRITWIP